MKKRGTGSVASDPLQYANCEIVPYTKWYEYNKALLTHNLEIECEYKTLRIPYMIWQNDNYPGEKVYTEEKDNKIIRGNFEKNNEL